MLLVLSHTYTHTFWHNVATVSLSNHLKILWEKKKKNSIERSVRSTSINNNDYSTVRTKIMHTIHRLLQIKFLLKQQTLIAILQNRVMVCVIFTQYLHNLFKCWYTWNSCYSIIIVLYTVQDEKRVTLLFYIYTKSQYSISNLFYFYMTLNIFSIGDQVYNNITLLCNMCLSAMSVEPSWLYTVLWWVKGRGSHLL